MLLQLRSIFTGEVSSISVDETMDFSTLEWQGQKPFCQPVTVKGSVTSQAGIVTLSCKVRYVYEGVCDRCAEQMHDERQFDVRHVLVTSLGNDDNEDFVLIDRFQLPLDELILSDFLLELPMKNLCKPDCKGLCMMCGQNLNQGACNCRRDLTDPRLAALDALRT